MKLPGIERHTLENYIQENPENLWASYLKEGMRMISIDKDAEVIEIEDRTVITSNQLGSFMLSFTHNPAATDNQLYAGLHTLSPSGKPGSLVIAGHVPQNVNGIKDFIFESVLTLVMTAEEDRKKGLNNVPGAIPMGPTGLLIMKIGVA